MCGEHGGDPSSIHFFQKEGIDYLSCSPYRIPIAKIAAAQAHIEQIARKLHVIMCSIIYFTVYYNCVMIGGCIALCALLLWLVCIHVMSGEAHDHAYTFLNYPIGFSPYPVL